MYAAGFGNQGAMDALVDFGRPRLIRLGETTSRMLGRYHLFEH